MNYLQKNNLRKRKLFNVRLFYHKHLYLIKKNKTFFKDIEFYQLIKKGLSEMKKMKNYLKLIGK